MLALDVYNPTPIIKLNIFTYPFQVCRVKKSEYYNMRMETCHFHSWKTIQYTQSTFTWLFDIANH